MSDYSAVNPPTEKNQSQAFAAALQRAKEVRNAAATRASHVVPAAVERVRERRRQRRLRGYETCYTRSLAPVVDVRSEKPRIGHNRDLPRPRRRRPPRWRRPPLFW